MPWMPIAPQAHDEERPAEVADGVRIEGTGIVKPEELPAAGELSTWVWDYYNLESGLSGKLGFSVGAIEASRNTRTLITEFSRSKTVVTDATTACFGVAARLVVNVSGLDATANLTLPFVAAEAQFNRAEASASLRVEGYVGPDTGDMFPDFGTFDVESYVTLMQSLSEMGKVIGANEELIRPIRLWTWTENEEDATDRRLTQGVATAWALSEIKNGHPREKALADYRDSTDAVAHAMIDQTYARMLHDDEEIPSEEVQARARRLLDGYELHLPWFR